MTVRIIDIARAAQVSASTVSLVLNGKPGVGEENRAKILELARDMGYQMRKPKVDSGSVQAPAIGASGESICFLHIARHGHTVNRDHDVFIADYIEGLGQGVRSQGLALEILTFTSTPIEHIIETACRHDAAGIIVLGTELSASDVEAFSKVRKPVVFIDTYHDFLGFDFVDMNNEDSVFTIVSYLKDFGHRRVGMVKSSIETRNFKLREEGFAASMARLGLERDESLDFVVDPTFHGAYEDMAAALKKRRNLPDALFCANDIIACGCLKAFGEAGIKVPDDLSTIGFDDLPLSSVVDPPLTTVQVSKARIGRMAVQLLAARMKAEPDSPPVKVLIGGKLIVRKSVRRIR